MKLQLLTYSLTALWTLSAGRGGERLIEIVCNGKPVAPKKVPADGKPHTVKSRLTLNNPDGHHVEVRFKPELSAS